MDVNWADENGVNISKGGASIDLTWEEVRHLEAGERAFRNDDSCVTTPTAQGERKMGLYTFTKGQLCLRRLSKQAGLPRQVSRRLSRLRIAGTSTSCPASMAIIITTR